MEEPVLGHQTHLLQVAEEELVKTGQMLQDLVQVKVETELLTQYLVLQLIMVEVAVEGKMLEYQGL
jgi:hypothetical protein